MSRPSLQLSRRWPSWLLALVVLGAGLTIAVASRPPGAHAEGEYVVVKHTYYLSDDGSVAVDEDESSVAAQYVVNAHRWASAAIPIPVYFNPAGQPVDYGTTGLLQNAIATWNTAGESSFAFKWAGTSAGAVGSCGSSLQLDGVNTVKFEPLPGLTLGQTCTVWDRNGGNSAKLVEFDMQLDSDSDVWSSSTQPQVGKYDLASTILHELGHAAGLGHSNEAGAVMNPTLASGVAKRTLSVDDLAGLRAAYPPVRARTMSLARD